VLRHPRLGVKGSSLPAVASKLRALDRGDQPSHGSIGSRGQMRGSAETVPAAMLKIPQDSGGTLSRRSRWGDPMLGNLHKRVGSASADGIARLCANVYSFE